MRMSKTVSVSIAIAVAAAAAVVPATFLTAGASTTACGSSCTSPYNELGGAGQALTVSGSNVEMATASNTNTGQDWTVLGEDTVATLVQYGLIPDKLAMDFGTSSVYQFEYAPGGSATNQCLADGSENTLPTNTPTTSVTLAPCGITAQTLWAADQNTLLSGLNGGYVDLISVGYQTTYSYLAPDSNTAAGSTSFTSPFDEPEVLTYSTSGKLSLTPLAEIGGVIPSTQLWGNYLSPAQAEIQKAKNAKKTG